MTKKTSGAPDRSKRMTRLSSLVEDMVEPSARHRGFVLSRLVSHWGEIVGDMAQWCKPVELKLDKSSRNDGVLKLSVASGRGPQAQQLTPAIIDRVNAVFGYAAINRVTLVQTFDSAPTGGHEMRWQSQQEAIASSNEDKPSLHQKTDIWTLDEKLAAIESPELRAALRRLGTDIEKE